MALPFLPTELAGHATEDELFAEALEIFRQDFLINGVKLGQHNVLVNTAITSAFGWEESFMHVVTREPANGQPRQRDSSRASRVPWIAPTIQNHQDSNLTYFMHLEGSGYVRHYIWNQPDDYVVILESKAGIRLVTAFNVDVDWKRYDLKRKQKKAIK